MLNIFFGIVFSWFFINFVKKFRINSIKLQKFLDKGGFKLTMHNIFWIFVLKNNIKSVDIVSGDAVKKFNTINLGQFILDLKLVKFYNNPLDVYNNSSKLLISLIDVHEDKEVLKLLTDSYKGVQ